MRAALRRAGAADPGGDLSAIVAAWPAAVGDAVARAAWPARLARDGTLHVATVSSTWAFELDRLAGQVLARLVEALGGEAPAALRFAPGRVPEPPAPAPGGGPQGPPPPAPEHRAAAERLAAPIADEELRALVARAAAASLARDGSGRGF